MFHLVSLLWDVVRHHRWRVLSGLGLSVLMAVTLRTGVDSLNASLTRQYTKTSVQQEHQSARDVARMRRRERIQKRMRSALLRASAGQEFPPFLHAVLPVDKVPDWGSMREPSQWNRSYGEMTAGDFVPVPLYDIHALTMPMATLISPLTPATVPLITAKLLYSTRFLGTYDIDSAEYAGTHAGVDLKLALGTPVGAIGGGKVVKVQQDRHLGLMVMIEHHLPDGTTLFSIYGHLGSVSATVGQAVLPGDIVGTVGLTGESTGAHLHLQLDRGESGENHTPYIVEHPLTPSEADRVLLNPISFISSHQSREVANGNSL